MDALYAGESLVPIILVTGVLGGGAAWLSGRAVARSWRPAWQVVIAGLLIGMAARFIHFALFDGELLSPMSYGCDTLFFVLIGLLAWRVTRTTQMVRQYPWLYTRTGPLRWQEVGHENPGPR